MNAAQGLMSPQLLAEWVHDSRQRTMDLVADLDDDQLIGPKLATVNPLLWEIGHLSWFQERWILRGLDGLPPIIDYADALWDSGAVPHDSRWHLDLPTRSEVLAYMGEVRDRVVERVLRATDGDPALRFVPYTVLHEDTHTEAITYTRQTLGYPAPTIDGLWGTRTEPRADGPLAGDVDILGGPHLLGATLAEPLAYDNEKWAHAIHVGPFAMARATVTEAEFAAFADDGGYRRSELWSHEGWAWRETVAAEQPHYWQRRDDGWQRRVFDRWESLAPDRPMMNVCWWEADAWCRWAGRRLPTEAEWEFAASGLGTKPRYPWGDADPTAEQANLQWQAAGPVDVGAHAAGESPFGIRQMIGNVWEWTATTFGPYPHFERDAYGDNSEPWFGSRKVLRGGAWATRARYIRTTYRNYFTPDRRDVYAGFRTCALT